MFLLNFHAALFMFNVYRCCLQDCCVQNFITPVVLLILIIGKIDTVTNWHQGGSEGTKTTFVLGWYIYLSKRKWACCSPPSSAPALHALLRHAISALRVMSTCELRIFLSFIPSQLRLYLYSLFLSSFFYAEKQFLWT